MSNFSRNPKPHFNDKELEMVRKGAKKISKKTISAMVKIISENEKILKEHDLEKHGYIYQ